MSLVVSFKISGRKRGMEMEMEMNKKEGFIVFWRRLMDLLVFFGNL